MNTTRASLGAASVARLAALALAVLMVAALVGQESAPTRARAAVPRPTPTVAAATYQPVAISLPTFSAASASPTTPVPKPVAGAPLVISAVLIATGIPETAMIAYHRAADAVNAHDSRCGIAWSLLAGIGRMESDHGRFGGAVLYSNGLSSIPIIGPALNGAGTAVIADTDHGQYDHDPRYDHAVGPMQFIPSTWARWGADGNGDGKRDPFNIFDATVAAASYLCSAGGDLRTTAGQTRAVFAYNHVPSYVAEVLALAAAYAAGRSGEVLPEIAAPPSGSRSSSPSSTRRPSPSSSASSSPCPSGSPSSSSSGSPSPSSSGSASTSPTPSPSSSPSSSPSPSGSSSSSGSPTPSPSPSCR